jgi:hypothetical protein
MIFGNQSTVLLCGGSSPAKAILACLQSGCSAYAMVCGNGLCECMPSHQYHHMQRLDGLLEKLMTPPKLPKAYIKAEKSINGLIDSCIADLQQLKMGHNEHIDKYVNSYRKFEQLRLKLISLESLNVGEATGDAVANMLKEI